MTWQPIETAPKDGTEVLVFTELGATASFYSEPWWRDALGGRELIGHFAPTHWMPIPERPKTKSGNDSVLRKSQMQAAQIEVTEEEAFMLLLAVETMDADEMINALGYSKADVETLARVKSKIEKAWFEEFEKTMTEEELAR
jgi:hypothetical protein